MSDFLRELAALRRAAGHRACAKLAIQSGVVRKASNQLGLRAELARKFEDVDRADLTDAELREFLNATGLSASEQIAMIDEILGE